MFNHIPLERFKLQRIDSPNGRKYITPEGNSYPSVSTVLGYHKEDWLTDWKTRVGEEEAARVSKRATDRGTAVHTMCEDYLNNKEVKVDLFYGDIIKEFFPVLDRIDNIHGQECSIWSDTLKMSGTLDCLGEFDGKLSLIDFKTAGRLKSKTDINNYFLQATAYSVMVLERYNLKVEQIVILIAVDNESPQIFIEKPSKYLKELFAVRKSCPL